MSQDFPEITVHFVLESPFSCHRCSRGIKYQFVSLGGEQKGILYEYNAV